MQRERQGRLQPSFLKVAEAYVPSVRLRDVACNAEAKSRPACFAAARTFEAIERFENLFDFAVRYSATVVAHANGRLVGSFLDPDLRFLAHRGQRCRRDWGSSV